MVSNELMYEKKNVFYQFTNIYIVCINGNCRCNFLEFRVRECVILFGLIGFFI